MSTYSIKDIERFSGIKAHTIRIWEQRYHLLSPNRSTTNIRTYNNADLRLLMNVSFLNNRGLKISQIAKLSADEINLRVNSISEASIVPAIQVENLVSAMIDYDEAKFEHIFETCSKQIGFEAILTDVIYPFLIKLGVFWHTGIASPGQEHFILNLIRKKIIVASDLIKVSPAHKPKKILLYLPENEFHEIALLYYNYCLRAMGHSTYYLGQSLPYEDLQKTYKELKPDFLLSVITCPKEDFDAQLYVNTLARDFKNATVFLTGGAMTLTPLVFPKNILSFKGHKHFHTLLKKQLS
jgi:DNA-binding transcriptional MerR regulator